MKKFLYDESGSASIEVAIITVALVALALVFKKQLMSLAKKVAEKILG